MWVIVCIGCKGARWHCKIDILVFLFSVIKKKKKSKHRNVSAAQEGATDWRGFLKIIELPKVCCEESLKALLESNLSVVSGTDCACVAYHFALKQQPDSLPSWSWRTWGLLGRWMCWSWRPRPPLSGWLHAASGGGARSSRPCWLLPQLRAGSCTWPASLPQRNPRHLDMITEKKHWLVCSNPTQKNIQLVNSQRDSHHPHARQQKTHIHRPSTCSTVH